jgi:probable addiction module antidote protein
MKPVKTTVWEPSEYLETEEQIAAYLEDIFKSGDPDLIVAAIGDVARAHGMSKIAADANSEVFVKKTIFHHGFSTFFPVENRVYPP